jgi:hypothetical protein
VVQHEEPLLITLPPIIEMVRMISTIIDNVLAVVHEEPLLIGCIL